VIAGGAGVLVLEELEHAKARGAKIYAEVVGYGATSDGYDMVRRRARARCAACGWRSPTSAARSTTSIRTPPRRRSATQGDRGDPRGGGDKCPPISATKSLTGHSLGAAGVQEAIYSLLMMKNGFICESANIENSIRRSPTCRSCAAHRRREARHVLSNSFGFGGTNATLVFKRYACVNREAEGCDPESFPGALFQTGLRFALLLGSNPRMTTLMSTGLMQGKRGLIMGVANDHSIAWGIAKTLAAHGAELAFTYQGEALGKRVKPLAESIGSALSCCPATSRTSPRSTRCSPLKAWGALDFLVHAIGFSDKNELKGRYADTTRENFTRTMVISCFSFTEAAKRAAELMPNGGAMLTLTYGGSTARHAELQRHGRRQGRAGSVGALSRRRFRPAEGIRVNAISAGPVRTLAGAGIADARYMFNFQQRHSPLAPHRVHRRDRRGGALSACPTCPPASPARSISSIRATTSSRCPEPLPRADREALLGQERHRPRVPRRLQPPAVRRGEGAVRERARAACCSCSRCRCSAPGWSTRCPRPARWAR
jgi:enoyl-[acyl-carrier protein] reductase I